MIQSRLRTSAIITALALGLTGTASAAEFTRVDTAASRIGFSYSQMGVELDGSFDKFKTELRFDPARPEAARTVLELQLASIDTGNVEANDEVKGKAWFHTAAHPTARFESSSVKPLGGNRYQLNGKLTIKGRTREVSAPLTYTPKGNTARFEGAFTIKRGDYAVGEGEWSDFGIVANEIKITFQVVAAAQ